MWLQRSAWYPYSTGLPKQQSSARHSDLVMRLAIASFRLLCGCEHSTASVSDTSQTMWLFFFDAPLPAPPLHDGCRLCERSARC